MEVGLDAFVLLWEHMDPSCRFHVLKLGKASRSGESRNSASGPVFLWVTGLLGIPRGTGDVIPIKCNNTFYQDFTLEVTSPPKDSQRNGGMLRSYVLPRCSFSFPSHHIHVKRIFCRSLPCEESSVALQERGVSYKRGSLMCLSSSLGNFLKLIL